MKTDLAAKIHKAMYGKSDKANSGDNQNPDFQAGFARGMQTDKKDSLIELVPVEWRRRGEPDVDTPEWEQFKE